MILTAAARTDVGLRRSANEDCFALAPDLGLYLVADGMGGHTAGKLASALASEGAVNALRQLGESNASLTERLRYCVAAANRESAAPGSPWLPVAIANTSWGGRKPRWSDCTKPCSSGHTPELLAAWK